MHLLRNGGGGGYVSARARGLPPRPGRRGCAGRVRGRGGPVPRPGRARRRVAPGVPDLARRAGPGRWSASRSRPARSAAARRRRWCRWRSSTTPAPADRLAAALAERAATTDARTVNRELSALRSAVGWWREPGMDRARTRPRDCGTASRPPRPGRLPPARSATCSGCPRGCGNRRCGGCFTTRARRRPRYWRWTRTRSICRGTGPGRARRRVAGRHRVAGGNQPDPALAAVRPHLGAGLPDRPQGPGPDRAGRCLPADRPGADVLPAGGGDLHRAHPAAGPGGPGLDPAPAQRREGRCPWLLTRC